jgi:pilus assembly protein CpaB
MRPKSLLLLALALGCGLIASIGISQVMESNKPGPTTVEKAKIYVAKVNINTGDPVSTEMVILKEWPKADVPPGAILDFAELEDRRPRAPIFAGEPILESKLLNPGEKGADPTQHIPKGFRIVPISVRADTGAAGLLRPGDRVDVQWYVARNPQIGIDETVSKTILHNIRVFAVDQTVTRPVNGEEQSHLAKTISLLLTPEQANKVQLATKIGEVSLIPRHPDDPSADDAAPITLASLFEGRGERGNSRSREQGLDTSEPAGSGFLSGLMSRVAAGAATSTSADQPIPPFEMELVMGDQVTHRMFDRKSGKPIRDLAPAYGYGQSFTGGNGNAASGAGKSGFEAGGNPITIPSPRSEEKEQLKDLGVRLPDNDPGEMPIDFPIDLGGEWDQTN